MNTFFGIHSLLRDIDQNIESATNAPMNILGGQENLLQMLLSGFCDKSLCDKICSKDLVIVLPHLKDLLAWKEKVEALSKSYKVKICPLPYYTSWGPERFSNHVSIMLEILNALYLLQNSEQRKIILCTPHSLAQRTFPKGKFSSLFFTVKEEDPLEIDTFLEKIEELGYRRSAHVEEKGSYALRGGIVDIFSTQEEHPVRIEFIGDNVSSLRYFSTESQKSFSEISELTVIPCSDFLRKQMDKKELRQKLYNYLLDTHVEQEEMNALMQAFEYDDKSPQIDAIKHSLSEQQSPLLDYISESIFIFPQSLSKTKEVFQDFKSEIQNLYEKDQEAHHAVSAPDKVFVATEELFSEIQNHPCLEFGNPFVEEDKKNVKYWKSTVPPHLKVHKERNVDSSLKALSKILDKETKVIFLCENSQRVAYARNFLESSKLDREIIELETPLPKVEDLLKAPSLCLSIGYLEEPLYDEESNVYFFSYEKFFGFKNKRKTEANKQLRNILSSFKDLSIEDLIVHIDHGIGQYKGLVQLDIEKNKYDFLVLEYKNKDKVYLPVNKLNLLQKYKKEEGGKTPALDKLGSDSFLQRKSRTLKSVEDIADQLLKTQAGRNMSKRSSYSIPSEIYEKFIEDFPYQETEDQLRSLEDIEEDFKKSTPMDRLIVGDVGFGKTEVALRAALRSILEGHQVLFLVPTTVLCYQHYYNFSYRLEKYGIKVAQVHRLIKGKEQKETLKDFAEGKLDLLIGTHRLLSQDVLPKNLGFIIVDEEQRFGVKQKEKLKRFTTNLDVLSLSATPIPRTLHMAFVGLRDISLITTPPADRMSVKTIVSQFDERIIKSAIEAELLRGGQVFYVHNRVGDLEETASFLRTLIPQAKVRTAHGQMHNESLDSIIIDFLEQKFNVLICTTIIESGVDMPNVNTLLIENAQNFGLSQLHQLRGRVGRSSIQAYAYLFTPRESLLTNEARKRLELLSTYQDLGSGFQLANYDLELRGAGNLIGKQQSGQIAGIGLEMYMDMLEEKIKEKSSVKIEDSKWDPEIKVKVTAIIPHTYIEEDRERLDLYKKLFSSKTEQEIYELESLLQDRFGPPPAECRTLIKVALLRILLRSRNIASILQLEPHSYELRFIDKSKHLLQLSQVSSAASDEKRMQLLCEELKLLPEAKEKEGDSD